MHTPAEQPINGPLEARGARPKGPSLTRMTITIWEGAQGRTHFSVGQRRAHGGDQAPTSISGMHWFLPNTFGARDLDLRTQLPQELPKTCSKSSVWSFGRRRDIVPWGPVHCYRPPRTVSSSVLTNGEVQDVGRLDVPTLKRRSYSTQQSWQIASCFACWIAQ